MPPGPPPPPPAPVAPSSIHDSDQTSLIKYKINRKPYKGEEHEDYQTTKKVTVLKTVGSNPPWGVHKELENITLLLFHCFICIGVGSSSDPLKYKKHIMFELLLTRQEKR
jgi:hypothetical protein